MKKKGIIIIKDIELQRIIAEVFSDWLVLASMTTKEEVAVYPLKENKKENDTKKKIKMTDEQIADQLEIDRLERLLWQRSDAYRIFGETGEDAMQDKEIRQKIQILKNSFRKEK